MPSGASSKRLVRIVVLSNAAAGAEKQALALSARLRDRLLRHPVAVRGDGDAGGGVSCVRVPFHSNSIAHKLPPLLQVATARLMGNMFFGYDLSDACKVQLQDGHEDGNDAAITKSMDGKQPAPLNVVVGCGRTTVALCATLKLMARHPSDIFNIQIQHPRVPLSWFDAVVAPRHDFPNEYLSRHSKQLHLTTGTVHDISKELLAEQTEQWRGKLDTYMQQQKKKTGRRRACVVWLIGGPCRGFAFTEQEAHAMVKQFVSVLKSIALGQGDDGNSVAVFATFSRRTPAKVTNRSSMSYWSSSKRAAGCASKPLMLVLLLCYGRSSRSSTATFTRASRKRISSSSGTARVRTRIMRSWGSRRLSSRPPTRSR